MVNPEDPSNTVEHPSNRGFSASDETCPECGSELFEKVEDSPGQSEIKQLHQTCVDCSYYAQIGVCPECGSELEGKTNGPDVFTGARSGLINCPSCDFREHWNE